MPDDVSEVLRVARERAASERGYIAPAQMTRAQRTVRRMQGGPAPAVGDDSMATLRDSNPVAAVRAAQQTYLTLKAAGLLLPDARALLTRDFDAAYRAVVRYGLRDQLKDASWPPRDPDDGDS